MFSRGKGAINKNDFPDMGEFPTMDGAKNAPTKPQETEVSKCNSAVIGSSFTSAAATGGPKPAGDKPEEKKMSFGGKPMFTNSRKDKNKFPGSESADVHEK